MGTAVQPTLGSRAPRVLLAGGDQISLTHLKGLLSKSGYDIVAAKEGQQALYLLESENPPNMAVLDWSMPGLNGIDICRRLRGHPRRRFCYIILLTAWNQRMDRVSGLEAGADECLYKPIDVRELRVRLQIGAQIILERALHESEERFRSAFEYAGVGMAVVSQQGNFLQTNRALSSFLGYSTEELQNMTLHDVCQPQDVPSSAQILERFWVEDNRSSDYERRFVTKNGLMAWGSCNISMVFDSEGRRASCVVQVHQRTQKGGGGFAPQRSPIPRHKQ